MLDESSILHSDCRVLAVDPGMSGAVALMGKGWLEVRRDFKSGREIAGGVFSLSEIEGAAPDFVVMEKVHAFPGQGVCSVWSFGRAAGTADGALAVSFPNLDVYEVTPQKWQNWVRAQLSIAKETEFDSRAICLSLFPSYGHILKRKKDHNTADALLIGVWALQNRRELQTRP